MTLPRWHHDYVKGVEYFLQTTFVQETQGDEFCCPCNKCIFRYYHTKDIHQELEVANVEQNLHVVVEDDVNLLTNNLEDLFLEEEELNNLEEDRHEEILPRIEKGKETNPEPEKARRNKRCRKKQKNMHTTGRTSFACVRNEMWMQHTSNRYRSPTVAVFSNIVAVFERYHMHDVVYQQVRSFGPPAS
ncbi:hypothetical protein KSP40_PGU013967 [Platanthera guangdongensis]|uniref:Transposase-associated domain-containing protein n=1 Tax=Platanthera guangdongensis TaxID=2320717 RepID=A0ABR2MTH2_9ASPA